MQSKWLDRFELKEKTENKLKLTEFLLLQVTLARHCGLGGDYAGRNHTYSALSRCNGNGSFKLTAAPGHLQRTHTLNNGQRWDTTRLGGGIGIVGGGVAADRPGTSPSGRGTPLPDTGNSTFPNANEDKYHQQYMSTNTDDNTVAAKTGSAVDAPHVHRDKKIPMLRNIGKSDVTPADATSTDKGTSSTLGTIAEKLRRGTKKVLQFKNASNASPSQTNVSQASKASKASKEKETRKLEKGNSVDSAHTNTISNSSLQEVDDDEFESAELAKYMGQVNSEIRWSKWIIKCWNMKFS